MRTILPGLLAAAILSATGWANGGGFFQGGVESSGTVSAFEPSQTQAVRVLDEQLTVDLGEKEAEVQVRYIMRNITEKRVKVRFGFPVEESFDRFTHEPAARALEIPKSAAGYRAALGKKLLKSNFVAENPAMSSVDKRYQGIAGWMVSEANFDPGKDTELTIRFRQPFSEDVTGISDDSNWSAKIFRYRLSTGAAWSGPIARGRIELRPKGIDPAELKILKPSKRFRKEEGGWVWEFTDLEPTLADDLEVEAVPARASYPRWADENNTDVPRVEWNQRGQRWTMGHSNYRVTASSELPTYKASNVADRDTKTAWAEGGQGSGAGEWLELRPEAPKPLSAIFIAPGYAESDALFAANARPKTVRIELNGERQFTGQIPDRNFGFQGYRIPVSGYEKPVKSVRLTFEDVWPGKTSDDLCVTDVWLEAVVTGKPKIEPAR